MWDRDSRSGCRSKWCRRCQRSRRSRRRAPPSRRGATMTTIMLVEDNELSRDALGRWLARRGYRIVVAVDGEQAIARARDERPDIILMDLGLPGVDGWDATRQLKAD